MAFHHTIKKFTCFLIFILNTQWIFAADGSNILCPTTDELRQFSLIETFMHGFNAKTQQITFAALLEQGSLGNWALELDSMEVAQGQDVAVITSDVLQQLTPVSLEPFADDYSVITGGKIPVCVYTLPGDEHVFGLAFFFGDIMTTTLSPESTNTQRRQLIMRHFHNR